jgi:hypothetical protein
MDADELGRTMVEAKIDQEELSRFLLDDNDKKWIYESPDKGTTIYRRRFGDPDNRQLIKDKGEYLTTDEVEAGDVGC